ncbi:MAG: pilus assembly protein N-terminal domain-containing protein [bacterium]
MKTTVKSMGIGWGVAILMWVAGTVAAVAADAEQVGVTVGKMELINVAFQVQGFRVADPAIAKVETLGPQQLRVMGLKAGATDLQVTGDGNVSALYTITVVENINAVLSAVKRDLDAVPEVDISINLGRVVIKGEISSIEHWNYLQKVIALYKGSVANLVTFQPTPEVMLALKKALEKSGFTVLTDEAVSSAPGTLRVKFTGNNVILMGQLYSQKDKDRIMQIVEAQSWLTLKPMDASKGEDTRVRAILDLTVVPTMLEMDVTFVGVTDEEERSIGVNLLKAGLLLVDSTATAFKGQFGANDSSGLSGSYVINSGMKGALKFFSGSGPGRFQTAGHLTFKNDSPEWRMFKSGGTLKVRIATRDTVGLSDINYGLIMRVKGGLLDPKTMVVDLDLSLSYPVPVGSDYDLKENKVETTVNCPVGQTLVVGGMKSLIEQSSNEGVPFLRSVPAISWFFSEKNKMLQNNKVLILISPQIVGATTASRPVSEETAPALKESSTPVDETEKKKRGRRFFFF